MHVELEQFLSHRGHTHPRGGLQDIAGCTLPSWGHMTLHLDSHMAARSRHRRSQAHTLHQDVYTSTTRGRKLRNKNNNHYKTAKKLNIFPLSCRRRCSCAPVAALGSELGSLLGRELVNEAISPLSLAANLTTCG